jgi:predicted aldo/keto reductase-like oxidoreductase
MPRMTTIARPLPSTSFSMPRRRFGRTGLSMPVLSCGGMRYQHAWTDKALPDIPSDSQANVEACIRRSVECGINHIETARGYGTSEVQLGPVLNEFPRDDLIVQTKLGPKETGEEFLRTFEQSMENLKLAYVDLLAIHGINNAELLEKAVRPGGSLDAAVRLKQQGRVRFIGFSTHAPLAAITEAIATDAFDYVNLHWYFVNEVNGPAIEAARRHDMGVFIISPNDKGGKLYEPPPKLVKLCAPLTPMQFNDLYCLCHDGVHTLSLGAARPSDFDEHIAGLAHYDERAVLTAEIAGRLRAEMERQLGADWCAHWADGLPDWTEVPGDINLSEIIRLWNFATALDMEAFAKMRYNLLGQGDHWFPGKNAATVDAGALRDVLSGYRFADRIPEILREAHRRFYEAPKKRLSES